MRSFKEPAFHMIPIGDPRRKELVDAYSGTGASVSWKENVHKMAEANKAYAHYAR